MLGSTAAGRPLGLALATLVLLAACGPKTEIVDVNREDLVPGAYRPFTRSTSPLVHADGHHEPAEDVIVGPAPADQPVPYTSFAASRDPGVHPAGNPHAVAQVSLAHERDGSGSASSGQGAASESSSHTASVDSPVAGASTPAGAVSLSSNALALIEDDEELATVTGRIEKLDGPSITVQTEGGLASKVRLTDNARLERDTLGTTADLKSGQLVGVLHTPGGPAASIRLYATGPSMLPPGVVPMAGSQVGQVTTFGSIVGLQFGGLLLNAGSQTTSVTLPNGVEILRPAPVDPGVLGVGAQVIALGPRSTDGTVPATAVRVTGAARPAR